MKEIIEADTGPMKEVLCLGATFTPTPTKQTICQIWAKERDYEGDHRG